MAKKAKEQASTVLVVEEAVVCAAVVDAVCTSEEDKDEIEEEGNKEGVASGLGMNADTSKEVKIFIDPEVYNLYDVYSYQHAAGILKHSFAPELEEIENALLKFKLTVQDIGLPGGNESRIPKKLSAILRPKGWIEKRIRGDLVVKLFEQGETKTAGKKRPKPQGKEHVTLKGYIDGHKIDYVKGRIAVDLEWNSKDQTYDRDLYAFRVFHECKVISVAVLITRSEKMDAIFPNIPLLGKNGKISLNKKTKLPISVKGKYGASTTCMEKLLRRLEAGRHGGCPVLVFGIRPDIVEGYTRGHTLTETAATLSITKKGKP
jgi:CRISPR-associated protein Csd2